MSKFQKYSELKIQLQQAKEERSVLKVRWAELREMDDSSYSNWNNDDIVNKRSKQEEREYNNLSKQLSGLNNKIMGLQKLILSTGIELLNDL